ncbi:MAG: MATE family efflux transporter [Oscillospiraceae bacterium]
MFPFLHRGKGFYADMASLAVPIILQNLITESLALADTFMVGFLGETPLAAVTLANIPIFVVLLLIFGIQSGSSVLISQHWGKRDTESINRVIGIGVFVALGITTLFALTMFCFPLQFMGLFSNDPVLVSMAADYAKIVGFSYIFNGVTQVYLGAHRSMENPRLGLGILSISMCTNTFLNWVLIFGKLGFPKLGIVGAAVATLTARIIEFVVMVLYAAFNRRFRLKLSLVLRPGTAMLRRFVAYSTPVVLNETFWGLGTSLYPTIMGHMEGSQAILAGFAIAGNIEKICTVVVFAIAGTAAIIVGREIGAGRSDTVYDVGLALNTVAFGAGLCVGIVMIFVTLFVIAPFVYPLFGLSAGAQSIATMMLVVTFATLSVRSFNSTNIVGVLRGGGDVRAAVVIDLGPLWFVALPLAALAGLVFHAGIFWVYVGITMENVVKFFLGVSRLRSGEWIHDVTQVSFQKGDEK